MIRPAEINEFESIRDFYYTLIDDMDGAEHFPKWKKGIYPSERDFSEALEKREMYVLDEGGQIKAAMRLNRSFPDEYAEAPWTVDAQSEEVSVIHLLAVGSAYFRQGIGREMIRFAIDRARSENLKAVRLDVLEGNPPACSLYESMGFRRIGKINLFYEDTGHVDFLLYEFRI